MKRICVTAVCSCVLALALASPALATEQQGQQGAPQGSQLPTMRADDVSGKKVVNDKNEDIGRVDSIVRDKATNKVNAVVSVGGLMGIGGHKVTIALEDLSLRGDRLAAPAGTTEDKLKQMPEYNESQFVKVPDDEKVTVGTRTGTGGGSKY